MPSLPLILAGLVVAIFALIYGTAVARVLSVRVREVTGVRRVDLGDVPIDELMSLQQAGEELEALGFQQRAVIEDDGLVEGGGHPAPALVYLDRDNRTLAVLAMAANPNRWRAFEVSFVSLSANGGAVETVSLAEHLLPPTLPEHQRVDAATVSWREQWERHQKEVSEHPTFVSTLLDVEVAIARLRKLQRASFLAQVERGEFVPRKGAQRGYRFGLGYALKLVVRSTRGENARLQAFAAAEKQAAKQAKARGLEPAAAPLRRDLTPEVAAFRRRDGIEQNRSSGWQKKLAFFAVSLALFAFAFGIQLSFSKVLILIGVLFFHELGHALAMRAFGYKDLQILFIPFLGAVAAGKKQGARPMEEIVVLLAGPVPGIVLGTALLMTGWGESVPWVQDTAYMMLFLNYLNLLPIVPLDGGRVMNIVLFDRFPNLQHAFSGLSAGAMALGGRAVDDNLLFCFGVFLLMGLPTQLKQNQLLSAARRSMQTPTDGDDLEAELDDDRPLHTIFAELAKPKFDKWNGETRYQFVRQLRDQLMRPTAGWGVALAGMAAYLMCTTAPLGAIGYLAWGQMQNAMVEFEAEHQASLADWNTRIEAATDEDAQTLALYHAGQHFYELGFEQDAQGYLERAAARLEGAGQPELESSVHLLLGQIYPEWEAGLDDEADLARTRGHLERALALREELHGADSLEVAEVLSQLYIDPARDPDGALATQRRLIAIHEQHLASDPQQRSALLLALQTESQIHAQIGSAAEAEASLLRGVSLVSDDAGAASESVFELSQVLDRLTKLYFAQERYDDVAAVIERRAALALDDDTGMLEYMQHSLDVDRAWLAYWRGDYAGARAGFEALLAAAEDERLPIIGTDLTTLPHLMNQATAAAQQGDREAAVALLARMREVLDDELGQSLDEYLDQVGRSDDVALASLAGNEMLRRQAEQARVLDPLIASL